MPAISIIIINFKTPELTLRCIDSIVSGNYNNYEIIIVDNHSGDDSIQKLEELDAPITLIQNDTNEGFGRANNLGYKHAKGKHVLFLNSDMVLHPDTLSTVLKVIEGNKEIGVLSCQLLNEDGTEQRSLFYHSGTFKNLLKDNLVLDKLCRFKKGEIRAVIGAFMLIPRKVIEEVGGFDPDFFMYSEELELCDRIRAKGFKIAQTDKTSAIHKHGGSTSDSEWSQRQKLASSQLYYRKRFGFSGLLLYHIVQCFNYFTNFIAMWWIDKNYRRGYFQSLKRYTFSLLYFWSIGFLQFRKRTGYLKVK